MKQQKMVTDIVKSEDGKKAIVEILAETLNNFTLFMMIQLTRIQEALTSEKEEFWAKMFTDQNL